MQPEGEDVDDLRSRVMNALTQLQLELSAFGWTSSLVPSIHTDPQSPPTLQLKHPVATEWGYTLSDPVRAIKTLTRKNFGDEEWGRELELSKTTPQNLLHPVLMRNLRGAVTDGGWSPQTLREVLLALCGSGCLTEEEAVWVMKAGPAMPFPGMEEWRPIDPFGRGDFPSAPNTGGPG